VLRLPWSSSVLTSVQESQRQSRPVIFIGYSFGGIIVKKALVMNKIEPVVDPGLIGCLFLGTPHHGSAFTFFGKLFSLFYHWSGSSTLFLQAIERESGQNVSLHADFVQACSGFGKRIVNCFETVPEYLGPFPLTQVVSPAAARLDIGQQVTINLNHRDLRRLEARGYYYEQLLGYLESLVGEVQRLLLSKHEANRKKNYDALAGIPYARGAAFDDRDQQANPCTEGTRITLLKTIHDWADDGDAETIFWLSGMAGTGKSTVARTVAQDLERKGFFVVSFFFRRNVQDRSSSAKFVTTIFRQLAAYVDLQPHLVDAWNKNPGVVDKILDTQWRSLVQEPLETVKHCHVALVIDAVDESGGMGERRDEMLDFLCHESNFENLNLRIFVTSRPHEIDIPGSYKKFDLHGIDEDRVEKDIGLFLKDRFRDFNQRTFKQRKFPTAEHIRILAKRSNPLFIAAMTSYRFIIEDAYDPESRFKLLIGQKQGPRSEANMDEMYLAIVTQALSGHGAMAGGPTETNIGRYQLLVGSLLILQDSLSVSDLASLLTQSRETVASFLKALRSILEIPESPAPVRLFHQSFRHFLLDEDRVEAACSKQEGAGSTPGDVWIDKKKTHTRLFQHCFDIMEGKNHESGSEPKLKKDICNLIGPGTMAADIGNDRLKKHIPPQLEYACKYWASHFIAGITEDSNCRIRLWTFLQRHLLHWVEAMSCLRSINRVIGYLDQLYQAVAPFDHQGNISQFIEDARRFIRYNDFVIERAPLQIYCSALLFAPDSSVVKQCFAWQIPSWIHTRPELDGKWSSDCLISGFTKKRLLTSNFLLAAM
jgi:hypothetical protein